MFTPKQIVFAPTGACNLNCSHCRVDRSRGGNGSALTVETAVAFLDQCLAHEIDRVGFSGGEPFLAIDFLEAVSKASVERGFYFDRLMTNATWFDDVDTMRGALQRLYAAGFDGTIAVSFDSYHAAPVEKVLQFIKAVTGIWQRGDCVELVSVLNRDGTAAVAYIDELAAGLSALVKREGGLPMAIQDQAYLETVRQGLDDGSGLYIPILLMPYSAAADDPVAWQASRWFKDDYCDGPGNLFFVHPDGAVAACCGFGNENPQLIIGTIQDSYERLMASATANSHIRDCYEKGLGRKRQEMEAAGVKLPGKTDDICFFCDWLCRRGTAE